MKFPLNTLGGTKHLPWEYSSNFIGSKCGYVKITLWFLTDLFVLRLVFQVLLLCHVRLDLHTLAVLVVQDVLSRVDYSDLDLGWQ